MSVLMEEDVLLARLCRRRRAVAARREALRRGQEDASLAAVLAGTRALVTCRGPDDPVVCASRARLSLQNVSHEQAS